MQYPRIAGQHAEYTETTLKNFREGVRRNNTPMQQIAARLSDADKRNVSAWFASQAAKPQFAKSKDSLELGQRIWRAGVPEKSVPTCRR